MEDHSKSTAARRVASLPELLQEILLHLDMKTLLLSQRVNQLFHDAVGGDLSLKKKLFLAPASFAEALDLTHQTDIVAMKRGHTDDLLLNRLLCPQESLGRSRYFRKVSIMLDEVDVTSTGSRASWGRTYITQPPSWKEAELTVIPTRSPLSLRFDILCLLAAHNDATSIHNKFHECSAPDTTKSLGDLIDAAKQAAAAGRMNDRTHSQFDPISGPEDIAWRYSSVSINGRIRSRKEITQRFVTTTTLRIAMMRMPN